ncbi:exopolyphosphatase [Vairimorpha necatrix]|uniref:Exopolyphosphatase n=1 Tax=Vairimorpha necatrix TaxID=6039 RepID=A0AAX4JEM4_9MICR
MIEIKESIGIFLKENKKKITGYPIDICMGDQSCDLSSFISSLVLAHAMNVIFVVNMKKDVFESKGELIWVCEKFQINIDDLIFLESPIGWPFKRTFNEYIYFKMGDQKIGLNYLSLILVNHNEITVEINRYPIKMIIDRHRLVPQISKSKTIYIDPEVGSTATLVSMYLSNDLSKKVKEKPKRYQINTNKLCSQIASLLIIPIIVDTNFLKKRISFNDIEQYKKLKRIACLSKKELKNNIKSIKKARRNDQFQSTSIILLKNYKYRSEHIYNYGISVIKCRV